MVRVGESCGDEKYIDKLELIGTTYSPGKVTISAGGSANTNYVLDNVSYEGFSSDLFLSTSNILFSCEVPPAAILYLAGIEPCTQNVTNIVDGETNVICVAWDPRPHLTNAVDVAGYFSWGGHSSLGSQYATNLVKWTGNSSWWVIETIESPNGQRYQTDYGNFIQWFSASAFGGADYSNTPVGAVMYVDEPWLPYINYAPTYFGLWAAGTSFGICAWQSRLTPYFAAVGDPLVAH